MNKKKIIRPLVIFLVLAVAGGSWWYSRHQQAEDTNRLVLYGNIDIREAYLAFNDSEHIDEILVQEGDHVKQGQLLATLHKARMQAQYAAAEAKVASRKAIVARLEAGSRPEETRQARVNVAAAEARLHDAKLIGGCSTCRCGIAYSWYENSCTSKHKPRYAIAITY